MRLDNKLAVLAEKFNLHNIRPHAEGGEEGGDSGEPVPARDVKLTKIPLTKKQFEQLVGLNAFDRYFNSVPGKPLEKADKSYSTLWLDDTYTNCAATFVFGNTNQKEIEIAGGAKIKNLSLHWPKALNERACCELTCTVQACFPRTLATLDMEEFKGKEIKVSLRFGAVEEVTENEKDKQVDLVEKAREDEEEEEARKSRRDNGNDAARAH